MKYALPVGAAGLVLYLLMKDAFAGDDKNKPVIEPKDDKNVVNPVIPVIPGGRPRRNPNAPAGSGVGTVAPHVRPGDPAKWRNGLLVHKAPATDSPLIAPEDASLTSLHANSGASYGGPPDEVILLEIGIADQSRVPTKRQWARVITPLGGKGFISQVDPRDQVSNLTNVTPPTQVVADIGAGLSDTTQDFPVPADAYPPVTAQTMAAPMSNETLKALTAISQNSAPAGAAGGAGTSGVSWRRR